MVPRCQRVHAYPEALKLQAVAFQQMLHYEGDWESMGVGFLNLLLQPGTIVMKPEEKLAKMVVCATQYGCWLYRSEIIPGNWLQFGPIAEQSLQYVSVEDPGQWRVCGMQAQACKLSEKNGAQGTVRLWPRFTGNATSVLKASAKRGFRGMTVATSSACGHTWQLISVGRTPRLRWWRGSASS